VLEELSVIPGRAITAFTQEAFRWNRVSFGMATHIGGVKTDPSKTVAEVTGALKMLAGVVATLTVKKEVMKERSGIFFTQASELADTLAREKGLSFRTAHRIMGTVVREAIAKGIKPSGIDARMIDAAAVEVIGKPLELAPEILARSLDTMEIVKARNGIGGTAPEAVRTSLRNRLARLDKDAGGVAEKLGGVARARADLESAVQEILR
jgi:argininosuccinate lyase